MIKSLGKLSDKEIVELRTKILEPLILAASKHGLEKGEVIKIAEAHWEFAIKPIAEREAEGQPAKAPAT